ncbi:MAG: pilus assembly protein PilP [Magnetococcales bacterium]|nr:pilus assembly protein PilP [Magnetococcales bacterium]
MIKPLSTAGTLLAACLITPMLADTAHAQIDITTPVVENLDAGKKAAAQLAQKNPGLAATDPDQAPGGSLEEMPAREAMAQNPTADQAPRRAPSAEGSQPMMEAATEQAVDPLSFSVKVAPKEVFIYRPEGKRDPFDNPFKGVAPVEDETTIKINRPKRIKEPLEAFQLDSLHLVAILFNIEGQEPVAMIQDTTGKGHLVKTGHYLGVNEGRIITIEDGAVLIVEPTPTQLDPKATRTTTLRLHGEENE